MLHTTITNNKTSFVYISSLIMPAGHESVAKNQLEHIGKFGLSLPIFCCTVPFSLV